MYRIPLTPASAAGPRRARRGAPLTSLSPRGYTALYMSARRGLLLAGSLWELVRFFLVLLIFASVLQGTSGAGAWVYPWLLVVGSGGLLIAAGGGMLSLFPERYAPLIALLRLGQALSVFSFILLTVTGALQVAVDSTILGMGRRAVTGGAVLLGVFLLDLLFMAVLIGWRPEEPSTPAVDPGSRLPDYEETEVNDFH
jgi:hypothetical protein